ncbi:cytochrome P450 [Ramlibacter sp. USB13]|uniref:Cytochrome P450 n=1 Tax=Ramlibacter cellulosilyticus TaxID=2764187 RepID=A0A923MVS1_9BURK|nr:cytochrome P450 [Ramlibacter cellulosilyticus]MBC5785613.1 cytochrome P450 [Ramlibacter cellulosilyticus]
MKHFCPAYPAPRATRASPLELFRATRRSWLEPLYERSYRMQMGEVHLPGLDLYMVNQPSLVRRVLVKEWQQFPKSPRLVAALQPLLGGGLLIANGEAWVRQRRTLQAVYSQASVDMVFPHMLAACEAMLERWRQLPQGSHDLEPDLNHVAADVIFRTIFSQPIEGADARKVFQAFQAYQAVAPALTLPALFGLRWFTMPWHRRRSARAAAQIRQLIEAMVRPRMEAMARGERPEQTDMLSVLLEARDPETGAALAFDEVVDQVAVMFLAGHETTASALTWALHLLANAPDVQERAHAEVAARMGARAPRVDDLKELPLVWNVFREALRLFPPVGFLAREAAAACPMRDKQVPAGATVMVAPWLIQRHRELWQEPDAFDPDRYLRPDGQEGLREAWLPFGLGPRACLGAAFALQEAALVLATVLRAYRLHPAAGHVPWPVGRLTIRPANGLRLVLEARRAA